MARVLRLLLVAFGLILASACGGSDQDVASQSTDGESTPPTSLDPAESGGDTATAAESDDTGSDDTGGGDEAATDDESGDEAQESNEGDDSSDSADDDSADDDGSAGGDGSEPAAAPDSVVAIDWRACWRAADALNADGGTPSNGGTVAVLPNCASGPNSVGSVGDMSHPNSRPVFRSSGANGNPSIEFTFEGDTLLQTNGGSPWTGDAVLNGSSTGVTLAWVGLTTKVNSHKAKYLVSGLSEASEYPMLLIEGEGSNRFAGYGGGSIEARSSEGTITDFDLKAVIVYLAPDRSASVVEVNGSDLQGGQDSILRGDVAGLTLGNKFSRNFSTTDHQFVFLGMYEGQMSESEKAAFWEYASGL